jgi:hypothetical protein
MKAVFDIPTGMTPVFITQEELPPFLPNSERAEHRGIVLAE